MDSRCQRKAFSRWSPVIQWDLLLISSMKSVPAMLTGPRVSKAIGTNVYRFIISAYFCSFLQAGTSAAEPAAELEITDVTCCQYICYGDIPTGTLSFRLLIFI